MTTRAERKQARRDLAAWLRAHGLAPAGEVWRLAHDDGCRDLDTLARAGTASGDMVKRHPTTRARFPIGLTDGVRLPDGSRVIGSPAVDPTTASVWVCVRDADGTTRDVELNPLLPIPDQTDRLRPAAPVKPRRTAPAWVQTAAAEYRDARDAWLALRESCQPLGARVAGAAGSTISYAQLDDESFREHYPPPRYRDFLASHAAARRDHAA
jgi:hypothetical protein